MILLPVTLATAGVLAIVFVLLSIAVSGQRGRSKIGLGTGAEASAALGQEHTAPKLLIAVRRHGHFAEYVPLSLVLLALLELAGTGRNVLLGLAATLIVARLMITAGMGRPAPNLLRAGGNIVQLLMLLVASGYALIAAASSF
ncbi:MAG TPA: MAPEG family protein [Rhizomicrobium sp.]|nr:MAPEG family protein [Rhizomicrobium sp.]